MKVRILIVTFVSTTLVFGQSGSQKSSSTTSPPNKVSDKERSQYFTAVSRSQIRIAKKVTVKQNKGANGVLKSITIIPQKKDQSALITCECIGCSPASVNGCGPYLDLDNIGYNLLTCKGNCVDGEGNLHDDKCAVVPPPWLGMGGNIAQQSGRQSVTTSSSGNARPKSSPTPDKKRPQ